MNPQNIREKTFEKAVFGGYDMSEVDNYLSEVSTELANAQRESAVLKSKMKVLVEKIEEYRANEDAMHLALLSAQKVSAQIQNEAEQKCAAMLEHAQLKSEEIIGAIKTQEKKEREQLMDAKRSSAEFLEHMRQICQKQLAFLDAVGSAEPELSRLMRDTVDTATASIKETRGQPPRHDNRVERSGRPYAQKRGTGDGGLDERTMRSIENSVNKLVEEPREDSRYSADYSGYDDDDDGDSTKNFSPINPPKLRLSFDDLRFGDGK